MYVCMYVCMYIYICTRTHLVIDIDGDMVGRHVYCEQAALTFPQGGGVDSAGASS